MFCPHCGKQMPEIAKFCAECGKSPMELGAAPVFPSQPEPVTEVSPECVPEIPVPQPEMVLTPPAKKKRVKALIVAACLVLAAVLAVGSYLGYRYYTDLQTYEKALALMEEGKHAEALKLFENLDIKDSAKKSKQLQARIAEEADKNEDDDPNDTTDQGIELVIKEAELAYTLTVADVEIFYDLLAESEKMILTSTDLDAVDAITTQLDAQYDYLDSQLSTAMVLYYCDLTDKAASDRFLSCTETVTKANNDLLEMSRRIYLSDAPTKEVLFADWTEDQIKLMLAHTPEITSLQQRNSEIEVAYQDLQDDPNMYDKMIPLYTEIVGNYNRMANIYGYDNFYTFAYDMVYQRDYNPSQIQTMRDYAAKHVAPALENAAVRMAEEMESLSMGNYLKFSSFLTREFNRDSLTDYLSVLPQQMATDMLDMFNGNILMMTAASGASEGGFTASITKERAVCFFGPGYGNIMTVIHELGHYYSSKHEIMDDLPLDLAELQSQGNEWLFMAFLEQDTNQKLYDVIESYKLYNDTAVILISLIVDEFEERVYTHPNAAKLTGDDLDAIMEEVCQPYGGSEYLSVILTDIQEYWRMVVVEQPVYYISYGVSAVAAMNLHTMAQEDFNGAVEAYRCLVEELDLEKGFLNNITAAGIPSPFTEQSYLDLAERFE